MVKTNKLDATYYVKGKFYKVSNGVVACPKEVESFFTGVEKKEAGKEVAPQDKTIKEQYEEKYGKKVPPRYTNDVERITSKL